MCAYLLKLQLMSANLNPLCQVRGLLPKSAMIGNEGEIHWRRGTPYHSETKAQDPIDNATTRKLPLPYFLVVMEKVLF